MADDLQAAERIEKEAQVDLFDAMPLAVRAALGARAERRRGIAALVAPGLPTAAFNRVLGLGVETVATEADVDSLIQLYAGAGVKSFWIQVSPAAMPEAVPHWLVERGFRLAERRAWVQCLRGTEAPGAIETPYEVRAIEAAEGSKLALALCAAHAMPPSLAPWIEALATRERWRAYAAFEGSEPVAGGLLFRAENRAWLGLAGTLAWHRKRGAQAALIALRLRDAIASGCTKIGTETGEPLENEPSPSLDNIVRAGFRVVGSRLNYALTLA
jgi:hypothetical protein